MLEAQVQKESVLTAARAYTDKKSRSRHDLQTVAEVMGPAHGRSHEKAVLSFGESGAGYRLGARPQGLDEDVEPGTREPTTL